MPKPTQRLEVNQAANGFIVWPPATGDYRSVEDARVFTSPEDMAAYVLEWGKAVAAPPAPTPNPKHRPEDLTRPSSADA